MTKPFLCFLWLKKIKCITVTVTSMFYSDAWCLAYRLLNTSHFLTACAVSYSRESLTYR